ncbi:MAG: hypothetical protein Q27BPR15_12440 [Rhodobacter sp. CACIA14H1]|nr:MAG: hypothetical protein Q27BPR15_12440 [Rhodobacter sp. CACIA14H1]
MGKVAQVLITGYWPDRVPRRIGVPQKPLGEQYLAAAAKAGDAPAILAGGGVTITHDALLAQVRLLAAGIAALVDVRGTVALAGQDRAAIIALILAAQVAGCRAAIVDDRRPGGVAAALAALAPDLTITTDATLPASDVPRVLTPAQVEAAGDRPGERRSRWRDVAVLLPEEQGFAGHGHVSTTAMVKALTTYIPLLERADAVLAGPLHRWDGYALAMTAILSGRAVVLDPAHPGLAPRDAWGVLSRAQADAIVQAGRAPDWARRVRLLFVVLSDFDVRWRKRLESALGRATPRPSGGRSALARRSAPIPAGHRWTCTACR